MNSLHKTIFILDIDNYAPEIKELTFPYIKAWANKIDAQVFRIQERKFHGWPITYEKLQIHVLAQQIGCDWAIYVDADTLIHPDFIDITSQLSKDTVCHNGKDPAMIRWTMDEYFLRDGRFTGSCNWFTVASDWCLDLWRPLDDLNLSEALERIHPVQGELNCGYCEAQHLIDDYTLSRNIARFGLKFTTVQQIYQKFGQLAAFMHHLYQISNEDKVKRMKVCLENLQKYGLFQNPTPPPEPTGRLDDILKEMKEWRRETPHETGL